MKTDGGITSKRIMLSKLEMKLGVKLKKLSINLYIVDPSDEKVH